jgi:hypothetical protein
VKAVSAAELIPQQYGREKYRDYETTENEQAHKPYCSRCSSAL